MFKRCLISLALALAAGASPALAQGPKIDEVPVVVSDPFEGANRLSYDVSHAVDQVTLRPIARGYMYLPSPIRTGVGNVLDYINTPATMVNALLQGNLDRAGISLLRFGANTVGGVGGLYDFASAHGLPKYQEDFGQTLGVWGVGAGPYIFIPMMGPSNARDVVGKAGDIALDPLTWVGGASGRLASQIRWGLAVVDARAEIEPTLVDLEKRSLDVYASIRSIYTQSRDADIKNGQFNAEALPDFDD